MTDRDLIAEARKTADLLTGHAVVSDGGKEMASRLLRDLASALEAAQRPPLGYVVGRLVIDGWTFNRFYGGPEYARAGAEQELAAQVEEDGLAMEWKVLEVREAQP